LQNRLMRLTGKPFERSTPVMAVMPLNVVAVIPWALPDHPQRPLPASDFFELAPPHLTVAWQFSLRTALPPRALSFVS